MKVRKKDKRIYKRKKYKIKNIRLKIHNFMIQYELIKISMDLKMKEWLYGNL